MLENLHLITGYYLLCLVFLVAGMKLASLRRDAAGGRRERNLFWIAPLLSYTDWRQRKRLTGNDRLRVWSKSVLFVLFLWLIVSFDLFIPTTCHWWFQGYLAIVPFWLMLEMVEAFLQLLWLPSGYLVPHITRHPLMASSVADFWGRRWNRLFRDWLYRICFLPNMNKPFIALGFVFFVSALFHEFLVSLPYYLVHGKSLFGWMIVYFGIQYLAIIFERKLLSDHPNLRRFMCWFAVLGPSPLLLNPGTLAIFHLVG